MAISGSILTCKWAVFISGRGSNLAALLDIRDQVNLSLVVSSDAKAYGLVRARRHGVPTLILPKPIHWENLNKELLSRGIQRIFLLGFMRIIPQTFIRHWTGKIVNVHPSLLPAYPGLNSFERALQDQAPIGATVHEVVEAVDAGKILKQKICWQKEDLNQSPERLELGLHITEHRLVREVATKWT